jgi:hypothetical protein
LDDITDAGGVPRAKIVDLAGLATLDQKPERTGNIAGVGEITAWLEVAD